MRLCDWCKERLARHLLESGEAFCSSECYHAARRGGEA